MPGKIKITSQFLAGYFIQVLVKNLSQQVKDFYSTEGAPNIFGIF